jgi:pyruvate/2-oxoglutarate dehydrogenase complex dihydrolipoamide dehydrogenase (E3) component
MNTTQIIGTFNWGTVRIHTATNTVTVNRTDGHMNKAQLTKAVESAGYLLASAGRTMNIPNLKVRVYKISAA